MNLANVINAPWAIQPEKLNELQAVYRAHVQGQSIDLEAVEARIGKSLDNSRTTSTVTNGVATAQIHGVIAKRMNLMMQISGGTSSEIAGQEFKQALNDPKVKSILLDIDSPGGTVDGTTELANAVFAARNEKPVTALANGMMASAAYWIGSAADAVYASASTALVWSIGVVAQHVDISEAETKAGVRTTEIYAGKYKRIASRHAPLSDAGRESIQDQVDYLYSLFVGAVSKHRGTTPDSVLDRMADGRIFIGQQAIDAGLIDGFATRDELLAGMANGTTPAATAAQPPQTRLDDMSEKLSKQEV